MKPAVLLSVGLILSAAAAVSRAADGDKVEGAIWKYQMVKVADAEAKRQGRFRINGTDIFQPRDKKPTKIGKIEGKPNQKPNVGDEVKVEFESLRATDDTTHKCRGRIVWDSPGEVHGRLVDDAGVHWNFKASRIQE